MPHRLHIDTERVLSLLARSYPDMGVVTLEAWQGWPGHPTGLKRQVADLAVKAGSALGCLIAAFIEDAAAWGPLWDHLQETHDLRPEPARFV